MKIYYSNKADFISDGFEKLYYFKIYNGTDLIETIHDNVSNLTESSTKDLKEYQLEKYQGSAENDYNSSSKFSQLGIVSPKEDVYYYNEGDMQSYSLKPIVSGSIRKKTWKSSDTLTSRLIKESTIRDISTIDSFVYFTFPYHFVNENLSKTLGSTNLEATRIWYNFIRHNMTIGNMIMAKDIVDKSHPTTIKHPNGGNEYTPKDIYQWRFDLSFSMVYTIKKYGYYNPIINSGLQMFYDGTHRLAYGSMVEKDVPYLQAIPQKKEYNYLTSKEFFTITPPFFRNNEHAIFLFNLTTKKIKVYFIKTNVMKTSIHKLTGDGGIRVKNGVELNKIIKEHVKKTTADCQIELNPIPPKPIQILESVVINKPLI